MGTRAKFGDLRIFICELTYDRMRLSNFETCLASLFGILLGFFFPKLGVILMSVAGPLYLVWFPLLALDLLRLE